MTGAPSTAGDGSAARPPLHSTLAARASPKVLISFLITLILVLGEWRYAILGGYARLAVALGACVITELVLSWVVRGQLASISSAYVSGISLALLVKPQSNLLWPFALGAFLAIASKYVITFRGRHLFNPSNFALGAFMLLASQKVAILSHQWGNEIGTNAVIWCFGFLIASRAKVLHVTATYVASFLALAAVRSAIGGSPLLAEIGPLTGPMYQLFIFFMVTDPRTTVSSRRGRITVAAAIALVEMGIRVAGDHHLPVLTPLYYSPPIFALFLVGPIAMSIDLRRRGRQDPDPAGRSQANRSRA